MSYYDQSLENARSAEGAWEKLSQVAVKGAEYDSPERQPHPKCLKGTRVDFLAHIYGLLDDPESRLIWIHGTAGVGKSAAAFSVAERMLCLTMTEQRSGEKRLAGTFFFSRKYTNRCMTGYFFATLAYQLAIKFPSIEADVTTTIRRNPALLDPQKSLRDQMEALFLRPLRRLHPRLQGCPALVFVVDALDECASETDIADLISLLGQALHERDLPVIHVLLTSRPEAHICEAIYEEENVRPLVHKIPAETSEQGVTSLISLDGADVDSDIYTFLEHSFTSLRRRYPTFPQPTEHELALLASRAGRRFIVASTMINFIRDGRSDPGDQLTLMLKLTNKLLRKTEVFKFYDEILGTCADPERAYLHLSVVAALANPPPMSQISELLGSREGWDVEKVLVQLRSVMDIPTDSNLPVNIYHSSVRDYALDPSNCSFFRKQYTMPHPHTLLVSSSLRLMIKRIPASTSLLEALLKLKTQSQAMESQAPEMLKSSLAFTTELPTPLEIFMALLWLRDGSSVLYPWLETPNGHAWLQTGMGNDWLKYQGRLDWLQTQAGWAWLRTGHGKKWLQTPNVQAWLKNLNELPWLETASGRNWLPTFYGQQWLETRIGREWLQTESGTVWLQTQSAQIWLEERGGSAWLKTESRYEWLRNSCGRIWLGTHSGKGWLKSESAQEWLETENARLWLESQDGRNWLEGSGGQRWLKGFGGQRWLKTGCGQGWLETWSGHMWPESGSGQARVRSWSGHGEWAQTKSGQEWLQTKEGVIWLQSKNGQRWLQTEEGMVWLQSENGQRWLQTKDAVIWLQSRDGQRWLQTKSAQEWLQTDSGQQWCETWSGRQWLHNESTREWLQTRRGREWLHTESGGQWLRSWDARVWLQTESAKLWLHSKITQEWLATEVTWEWLKTEVAPDWLRTKVAQERLKIRGGKIDFTYGQLTTAAAQLEDMPRTEVVQDTPLQARIESGRESLKARDGTERLKTYTGIYLISEDGLGSKRVTSEGRDARKWLKTEVARVWLKTNDGRKWLMGGGLQVLVWGQAGNPRLLGREEWLMTDGRKWLNSDDGREWLKSKSSNGRVWLWERNRWLSTVGREWLQDEDRREWLKFEDGREWLNTEDGREWLQSKNGEDWLHIEDGREWLQTAHGQA